MNTTQTQETQNGNFSVYSNPTVTTPDEIHESDEELSLKEAQALMNKEVQEKTEKVFALHATILNSGKFCIGKAVECGRELRDIKEILPPGEFTEWCRKNLGDKLSPTRYRQYIRLSESVEKSPNILVNCETITEALEVCGILRDKKEKGTEPDGEKNPSNQNGPAKDEFQTVKKLVQEIKKTIDGIAKERVCTRDALILELEPLAKLYTEQAEAVAKFNAERSQTVQPS